MEYTAEQLNYFRICFIAFNLVSEGLRNIFKQEWDFRYKTSTFGEWKDTPQNGRDFDNNESRKSRRKNARYLATIKIGNTAEWDCSCLFFAILFSDSIGTTLSAAIRSDVDDIRQVRNDIAHISEAELTDTEFKNHVDRVLLAFNSLGLPISEIETVKNQTSFPTAEVNYLKMQATNLQAELKKTKSDFQVAQNTIKTKEDQVKTLASDLQVAEHTIQRKEEQVECLTQEINSKVESFCNLTFKPSHEIIRRSNDVTRIMSKMQELEGESNGVVSTIYLSGNPGCGKSQIARQIGQEFFTIKSRDNEGLTFVATLNAETLETLADSYICLAKQLGITEYTLTSLATSKVISPKEIIQHLQRLICLKIKLFAQWLIIADNVVDLCLVRSYLPQTASNEWGHGQVLITTQDSSSIPASAPHTYHESLSAGMQSDDAVELLKQVSQMSNDEQAKEVTETLEFQPLALAAAAFYVQTVVRNGSPSYSWTNYLETFRCGEREATEEVLAKENTAYPKTMTTAIEMAINRASESDHVLRQAFSFFSLCASESLPIEAVVNFVKVRTRGQADELIRAKVLRSSLITCLYSKDGAPAYLKVHGLVHEVLKKMSTLDVEFTERAECISKAIQVFHSLSKSDHNHLFESGNVVVKLRKVTTHCKVLHEILTSTFPETSTLVKDLTPLIAPFDVVSWLCSTASLCCDLSNPSDANFFSSSACHFVQYITSARKADVLKADVFAVHGRALSMSCQYNLSISYHEEATKIYSASYGEEHAKIAANYNELGEVYSKIGNHHQAQEYHERALVISKAIYGEKHADVARSYNNLGGNVYYILGQLNQAKEYLEKALIIRRTIFAEEHADIATTYNNLGNVYCGLAQYKKANKYHEKALVIRKKIYGEEHADVAESYNNLASVYNSLAQYKQEKEYQEKALVIQRKIYGEEHADVAGSYNNLGSVYHSLAQYKQAKEYHEKALVIQRKIYGEEHAEVAISYNNLGGVYHSLAQYNQATEYRVKALVIQRKIYGEEHAHVAISYNNLGSIYHSLAQYKEAKEYHEKALVINRKIFGEEHDDVATSYNNLGRVYHSLAEYKQAKEYHEKALVIQRTIYGEENAHVARSYNNLGSVYHSLAQYKQAKEYHEKALVLQRKSYGEEHADVAGSYNNLGGVYHSLEQYMQAKEYYEKALVIQRNIYGEEHANVASSYDRLGSVYFSLAQYNQAKEYVEKALVIQRNIYGEEHSYVATSYSNLGSVFNRLTQYKEAKEYHEKALVIQRNIYGEEHADVARSYNILGNVYHSLAQYKEAKEYHEKALVIERKLYGEEHADIATIDNDLEFFYHSLNLAQYKQAKEYQISPLFFFLFCWLVYYYLL